MKNSILDHVITNLESNKTNHGVLDYTFADHLPIYALLKPSSPQNVDKSSVSNLQSIVETTAKLMQSNTKHHTCQHNNMCVKHHFCIPMIYSKMLLKCQIRMENKVSFVS